MFANDLSRMTVDVNLVVHIDHRSITADKLTMLLLQKYPLEFASINQYGRTIPGFRRGLDEDERCIRPGCLTAAHPARTHHCHSLLPSNHRWPDRQALELPEWLFREKVLSQYQRQGSAMEGTDIRDLVHLIPSLRPGLQVLDFDSGATFSEALRNSLTKRPALKSRSIAEVSTG